MRQKWNQKWITKEWPMCLPLFLYCFVSISTLNSLRSMDRGEFRMIQLSWMENVVQQRETRSDEMRKLPTPSYSRRINEWHSWKFRHHKDIYQSLGIKSQFIAHAINNRSKRNFNNGVFGCTPLLCESKWTLLWCWRHIEFIIHYKWDHFDCESWTWTK